MWIIWNNGNTKNKGRYDTGRHYEKMKTYKMINVEWYKGTRRNQTIILG